MSDNPIVKGLKGVGMLAVIIGMVASMAVVYTTIFLIGAITIAVRLIGLWFWQLLPAAIIVLFGALTYKILQY